MKKQNAEKTTEIQNRDWAHINIKYILNKHGTMTVPTFIPDLWYGGSDSNLVWLSRPASLH